MAAAGMLSRTHDRSGANEWPATEIAGHALGPRRYLSERLLDGCKLLEADIHRVASNVTFGSLAVIVLVALHVG